MIWSYEIRIHLALVDVARNYDDFSQRMIKAIGALSSIICHHHEMTFFANIMQQGAKADFLRKIEMGQLKSKVS